MNEIGVALLKRFAGCVAISLCALALQPHAEAAPADNVNPAVQYRALENARIAPDLISRLQSGALDADQNVQLIIQLHGGLDEAFNKLSQDIPMRLNRQLHGIGALAIEISARHIATLARHDLVAWISPDRTLILAKKPDPFGHLVVTSAAEQVIDSSWNKSKLNGKGVTVAVIDSGACMDKKHAPVYIKPA